MQKTETIGNADLQHLILKNVKLDDSPSGVLGQGSFGTVYKAEYNGTSCAAKQLDTSEHPSVISSILANQTKQKFLLECLQHSKLHHPNIVKMLGVFYPSGGQAVLPVLVMELMNYNLTQLLEKYHNIPMYIKLSILQDVSRGLCYLHAQNPPIVHQALYSDNILITASLQAKIGDFKTGAETVSDQTLLRVRQSIRNNKGFLPDASHTLEYDLPLNVFSFGCVVCHVITQKWPRKALPFNTPPIASLWSQDSDSTISTQSCKPELKPLPFISFSPPNEITSNTSSPVSVLPEESSILFSSPNKVTEEFEIPTGAVSTPPNRITKAYEISPPQWNSSMVGFMVDDWSVKQHQKYIDLISDISLKKLVESCLQHNSKNRPHMLQINETITSIMAGMFA